MEISKVYVKTAIMGVRLQLDIYPQISIDVIYGIFRKSLESTESVLPDLSLDSYGSAGVTSAV